MKRNIIQSDLAHQLQWVYERVFGAKKHESDYPQIFKAILTRSKIPKNDFIILAWMKEHYGQDYSMEQVANETGINSEEIDKCLDNLNDAHLVEEDEQHSVEISLDNINRYYELEKEELEASFALDGKWSENMEEPIERFETFEHTEKDLHDALKRVAITFVDDGLQTFSSAMFDEFAAKHPDAQLSKGYRELFLNLNSSEQQALAFLAGMVIWKGFVPHDYNSGCNMYDEFDALVQKGMAVMCPQDVGKDDVRHDNRIIISPKACKALFFGHRELLRYSSMAQLAELIKFEEIREKELFFEDEDRNIVETLNKIISEEKYLEVKTRLEKKGRNAGISIILYGGPGVGKTELVRQLARRSSRDIFNVDASKIYGSLWGETEKNVRAVFRNFKYMSCICPNAPILLFNEADGIFKKREFGLGSAIMHAENIVQTIILQEMENFEGFLFATTNIFESIDKSFERRFLFKLNVHSPGWATRAKIWGSLLPELNEQERNILAERYLFSGGQIDNILRRWDIFEALEGRTPTMSEITSFCEEEKSAEHHTRIGFVIDAYPPQKPHQKQLKN